MRNLSGGFCHGLLTGERLNSTSLRLTPPTLDIRFKLYISTISKGFESDMGFM